jgi:CheY-like chemotaxis protein
VDGESEARRRRARAAGFDHHLTKPVDPVLLSEMMARSGRGSRARIANQSFLEQPIAGEDERADPGQPQGH